jgi:ubiquinol-cytochrome c reductase cytochrome b subunit/menaquinol-cytochrome c reductase cytochrome b/c subunit
VNTAEKERYLREYEVLKKKGKPFFPYAVTKDSAMALLVVVVIMVMAIVLGAEQGPKVDPTTTTYTPRPEWYFFFLFELLRVLKPPWLVPLATIGIPTIAMVLLLLLPFYDRNPERRPERRPIAMTALVLTVIAMAFLTYEGANTGAPTEIAQAIPGGKGKAAAAAVGITPAEFKTLKGGKEVVAQSGCLACHKLGENGNAGPGPTLTHIGARIPRNGILRSLRAGPGIMPAFNDLPPRKLKTIADYLASLN